VRLIEQATRRRSETGQALVISVVFLVVLLAFAGAVIDVGSWYYQHRKLQATADAAALAGAQGLRNGTAVSLAVQYGDLNGGGVSSGDVTLDTIKVTNDTIRVSAKKTAPSFFTKVLGIDSVNVGARAVARAGVPAKARYAAQIAVDVKHPMLSGCPCWGEETELDLQKVGPGAFRLINLDGSFGGTGPSKVSDWITNGWDGLMPLDWYFSDSGAKFSSSQIQSAMAGRTGDVMLFPIYSETREEGSNFQYYVIGWAGFHVTGFEAHGNGGKVFGWFESVIWEGILGEPADTENDFGVRAIQLVG
jgi:Putative Flp pilus-assembly TadE/G-like